MSEPRRSARSTKRGRDDVPDWAQAGLSELIKGNEASLCQMLDAKNLSEDNIKEKLVEVMNQQNLNAEGLLARFFNVSMLRAYAKAAGKSPNGSTAVLAARISAHWQKASIRQNTGKERLVDDVAAASTAPTAPTAPAAPEIPTAPVVPIAVPIDEGLEMEASEEASKVQAEIRRKAFRAEHPDSSSESCSDICGSDEEEVLRCDVCGRSAEGVAPRRGYDYKANVCGGCCSLDDDDDADDDDDDDM
mmetsp:Transcript_15323/g.25871  ORF Transcript_15323/g.25871 Transcript_15323/m.25871 type:complete len:247 (+) Transcript_15323:359-1099(+)|eukprot:CAMPEP_0198207996 /NCGR_PEP_ID=MMETSP1445-20131203/11405_1 /TAXON_ID=36898 /ORGANISM="Pyramimonas sp., Strain CCMP2087" /LENGTH=246 /DNA_ID=CAMNT_0043881227 /DNA_START=346 /DNA_END=1086 /DNA_ORIENTATION=+